MKYSKQRELIYNCVMDSLIHPTAETVYGILKKDNPQISLATVYRNLQQLSEKGDIARLYFPCGPDRYDGRTEPHYHGVCVKCGGVADVSVDYFKNIDKIVEKETGLDILSHSIIFGIICPGCAEKTA